MQWVIVSIHMNQYIIFISDIGSKVLEDTQWREINSCKNNKRKIHKRVYMPVLAIFFGIIKLKLFI